LPTILEVMASCSTLPPVIWKSDFYFTPQALELLNDAVDIYLPDFKFGNNACARKLAGIENYIDIITRNLERAALQGDMIIRHLLLPEHFDCCYRPIVDWVGKHLPDTKFSLREGYLPRWQAYRSPEMARPLTLCETDRARDLAVRAGLRLVY
jgi:putative pyruvate formate lyase activating enzyme